MGENPQPASRERYWQRGVMPVRIFHNSTLDRLHSETSSSWLPQHSVLTVVPPLADAPAKMTMSWACVRNQIGRRETPVGS